MRLGYKRHRRVKPFIWAAIILFLLIFIMIRMEPSFLQYAKSYGNNEANRIVNDAVLKVFADSPQISTVEKDDSGAVVSVENDTQTINLIKSGILQEIQNNIGKSATVKIPIGSISRFYILNGMGFKVPIKISPIGLISSEFEDDFSSAGINQVKHTVMLKVTIEMAYSGFMLNESENVQVEIPVIETVTMGSVPNYYGSGTTVLGGFTSGERTE